MATVANPKLRRLLPLRLAVENLRVFADQGVVRVTTPEGFLWLPVLVPDAWQHLINLPHGVSEFVQRDKDWYLMLAVKTEEVPGQDGPHFGLDLGLANLAVLSGPGVVRFFDAKLLRYMRGRYFRYRQALQRKDKTGRVKRSKGRESRWVKCENHRVSRLRTVNRRIARSRRIHGHKRRSNRRERLQEQRRRLYARVSHLRMAAHKATTKVAKRSSSRNPLPLGGGSCCGLQSALIRRNGG